MVSVAARVIGAIMVMGLLAGCGAGAGDLAQRVQEIEGVENATVEVMRPGAPWNRAGRLVVQVSDSSEVSHQDVVLHSLVLLAQSFPDPSQSVLATFTTDSNLDVTADTTPLPDFAEMIENLPFHARPINQASVSANPEDILAWAESNGYEVE